jgi:hypothetical protein
MNAEPAAGADHRNTFAGLHARPAQPL